MYSIVVRRSRQNGGFAASLPMLPGCRSQGKTEEEALNKIRTAIAEHLKEAKIVRIQIEDDALPAENPWQSIAGMFEDDPVFEKVDREIRKNRRGVDKETRIRLDSCRK